MKRRSIVGALAASLIGVLALGGPAQAYTIDAYFLPGDSSFTTTVPCGFPVTVAVQGDFHEVDAYDANGTLVRIVVTQGHGTDVVSATAQGTTLVAAVPQNYAYHFTLNADGSVTERNTGNYVHFTVPGQGNIFIQVGIFIRVDGTLVFQAGPDQDFSGDTAEFCAAFG
jgi:hypothetical protein